ncbi:DNA gyrase subunit A, partial [Candidatus Marsarchaeota archaeon]|nr:DNA gyrase subunit A [Candidatus Marsarchaeota archaeon]
YAILGADSEVYKIIAEETTDIREKYSRERRTKVMGNLSDIEITRESLVVDEDISVILTANGYLKRLPVNSYKEQDRGGRGVIAIQPKEGDRVKQVLYCRSKDYLLMLTNMGTAYWLKAYMVPEEGRYTAGKAAVNMVKLDEGERIEKIVNTRVFEGKRIAFVTQKGIVKRVSAEAFSRPRSSGIRAISMDEGDSLVDVCLSDGKSELFISTRNGKAIRFDENRVRLMGRGAYGVRGIRLSGDDRVTNIIEVKSGDKIASITENGFGKVTEIEKYRLQGRGGTGVLNIKITPKTGKVVKSMKVSDGNSVILISSEGVAIKFSVSGIRKTGRSASGVRLMRLSNGAKVVDAQEIAGQSGAEEVQPAA